MSVNPIGQPDIAYANFTWSVPSQLESLPRPTVGPYFPTKNIILPISIMPTTLLTIAAASKYLL